MPQIIHYQDDLFFLSVLIKALDSGLSTEADAEHFRGTVLGNIEFIGSSLGRFLELLEQNIVLIDRAEYAKLLERTARAYAIVLEKLLGGSYPAAEAYSGSRQQLLELDSTRKNAQSRLEALLAATMGDEGGSDLVSEDELSELLRE
ncbi:MAG TPA: hypothetical protein VMV90_09265 [Rectinemataceae bacterium]|nr:hypothetical protein [Rectinemataceae bacterium]